MVVRVAERRVGRLVGRAEAVVLALLRVRRSEAEASQERPHTSHQGCSASRIKRTQSARTPRREQGRRSGSGATRGLEPTGLQGWPEMDVQTPRVETDDGNNGQVSREESASASSPPGPHVVRAKSAGRPDKRSNPISVRPTPVNAWATSFGPRRFPDPLDRPPIELPHQWCPRRPQSMPPRMGPAARTRCAPAAPRRSHRQ